MLHYNKHKNNKSVNYKCKWKQFGEAADNVLELKMLDQLLLLICSYQMPNYMHFIP